MSHRFLASLFIFTAVVLLVPLAAAAQAGSSALRRTPWGDPDLQGVWGNNSATPLQRPDAFAGKEVLTDEELAELRRKAAEVLDGDDAFFGDDFVTAALSENKQARSFDTQTGNYNQFWLVERDFEKRTSLIVDPPNGKLPALTPEGQRRAEAELQRVFGGSRATGPEDLSLLVRCITFGLPNLFAGYNSYFQVLQAPGYVVMSHEMIHDTRIIPLDGRPPIAQQIRQWHGDSRGRWEGDTLVVETRNYSPETRLLIPGSGAGGDTLHVVERFTRVGPKTMRWDVTFNDPATWRQPWTARMFVQQRDDAIFEYACHEGNYAIAGILAGARAEEQAAAGSATTRPR
jgi:hypothetical protein